MRDLEEFRPEPLSLVQNKNSRKAITIKGYIVE